VHKGGKYSKLNRQMPITKHNCLPGSKMSVLSLYQE